MHIFWKLQSLSKPTHQGHQSRVIRGVLLGALMACTRFSGATEPAYSVRWIRQLGLSGGDAARGVAVDSSGTVYVVGSTEGSLVGPSLGNTDAILVLFDPSGNAVGGRQFGTSRGDGAWAVSLDDRGGMYIA